MAGPEFNTTNSVRVQNSFINSKTSRRGDSINNIEVINCDHAAVVESQSVAANDPLKKNKSLPRISKAQSFIRLLNCCSSRNSPGHCDDFYGNKNIEDDNRFVDMEHTSLDRDSIERHKQKIHHSYSDSVLDKLLDRAQSSDQVFAMVGPKYKFRGGFQ